MLADEVDPLELAAEDDRRAGLAIEPAPKVIVLYRDRGIPWLLVPPLLLFAAVLGIVVYRNSSPRRPHPIEVATRHPDPPEPGQADRIEQASKSEPVEANMPAPAQPSKVGEGPGPGPVVAQGPPPGAPGPGIPEGRAVVATSPFDPVPAPAGPKPAPAGPPIEGPKAEPRAGAGAVPQPPPTGPARRDPVGFDREPIPGPGVGQKPPSPFDPPEAEAPNPTAAETDANLRREADRIALERRRLEAAKPDMLHPDPRDARARLAELMAQSRQSVEETRRPFHRDLRRLLNEFGRDGGAEIRRLNDRYGKEMLPELLRGMNRDLVGPSSRLTTAARVQRMRRWGAPETMILEDLFLQEQLNRSGRGGPRTDAEAWVFASKVLLSIPPGERPAPTPAAGR